RKQRRLALGFSILLVVALAAVISISRSGSATSAEAPTSAPCVVAPSREEEAAELIESGAAIVYHRTAGPTCVDELYASYPDGRITSTKGVDIVERQVPPAE